MKQQPYFLLVTFNHPNQHFISMFGLLVQSSVSNILSNTSLIFQLKVTLSKLSCFSWTQGSEASFHLLIPPTTKGTAFCSLIQNIYIFWYKRKTKIVIFYPLTGTVTEFYVWLLHESYISLCDRLVISDGIYFLLLNGFSQSSSVQSLSHVPLCDPMNRSMPGLPVHHQLPEFTQTHAHRVSDAIQPSHPLLSPSPPAPNPCQHEGLLQWVSSSHEMAKVLEFQLQHQSLQWTPRTDLL